MHDKKSLSTFLTDKGLDAMLVSSVNNISYLSSYFGFSPLERDAYLLFTHDTRYIFTNSLYTHEVASQNTDIRIIEHTKKDPFPKNLATVLAKGKLENIGFENDDITVLEYLKITSATPAHFIAVSLDHLRITKTPDEIQKIKKACEVADTALTMIKKHMKAGITEKKLASLLELAIKKLGADLSFPTIVAFGKNSAIPHHHTDDTELKTQDIILLDFGVRYENYCSDMSRTFFIGKPTKKHKECYTTVLNSQTESVTYIENRLSKNLPIDTEKVDRVARDYILSKDFPAIPHSVGHGIGLEVHEPPSLSPNSTDMLSEGMVFSIEPGVYIQNEFGIRIEDLYTIHDNILIQLTQSPVSLQEI